VEEPNVYDNGAENGEPERDEAANQEKQAANYLQTANSVNVTAGEKGVQIFAGEILREGRHGKEVKECVRTKDNEDQSKKDAGNDGGDFHNLSILP
jgi:hypothetical protein